MRLPRSKNYQDESQTESEELKRRKQKYGIVSMCVGTGQGAAGIFEML